MTNSTDEELLSDLGLDAENESKPSGSARAARIIAGFEEIERFYENNKRLPFPGEGKDIFERIYALRLEAIRSSQECLDALSGKDSHGLLKGAKAVDEVNEVGELDDDELLAELGAIPLDDSDITKLKNVKPRGEVNEAEMARRKPCKEFAKFKPLFTKVQTELNSGFRRTLPFKENIQINVGDFFILSGQKIYVSEIGEEVLDEVDKADRRLRIIIDNGTESNLLLRSLQRALNKDPTGRRITDPTTSGSLFSGIPEVGDNASGTVYVLRSKSKLPQIAKSREVIHKIGVTSDDVKKRVSNSKLDPTFLMAEVEIVATYELSNINRTKLEKLIHNFFENARLEIEIKDRFGNPVVPREWFLVPIFIINEAIERIKDGSIVRCKYDVKKGKILEIS